MVIDALLLLPLWILGAVILAVSLGAALGGVWLVRRRGWMLQEVDSGAATLAHAFIGVLYAVALGLMVVAVQGGYEEVESVVMREADLVGDLYRDLEGFADEDRVRLQGLTRRYLDAVITDEWPTVARGERSVHTWALADSLAYGVITYRPQGPGSEVVFGEVLAGVNQLLDARRERLFLGTSGVGAVTWVVVLIGAIITIGVGWFYHTPSARAHYALTGAMAAMFGLMIFLIVAMDHPLMGRFGVQPHALEMVGENLTRWDGARPAAPGEASSPSTDGT